MNSKANTCRIVLGTKCLEYTREPVASNTAELFPKAQISGVYPIKINQRPAAPDDQAWKYRFDKMVCVNIQMADGETSFTFDVQEVTNQIGWTANLAGQQQCIADIKAWLP